MYRDLVVKEIVGELEIAEQQALPFIAQAFFHLSILAPVCKGDHSLWV